MAVACVVALAVLSTCCAGARKSEADDPAREARSERGPDSAVGAERGQREAVELTPQKTSPFCLEGCPETRPPSRNRILERDGFVLSNNALTKFADWAAYRVTSQTIGRSKRVPWRADPELPPEETLEPEDLRGAHARLKTDRGHQVPLASFSGTGQYRELAYTSNLTPQRSELNQLLWNHLEQAVRDLAEERGSHGVFVVTGPLFERTMESLPEADEPHRVPSGYFKVVAIREVERIEVVAFVVDQDTPGQRSHCEHRVSVDEVERRSGWDLFVGLPDSQEIALESELGTLGSRLGCDW